MPNEKARAIIRNAMQDKSVYAEMAKKEADVWSNYFADPEKEEVRKKEQDAGLVLKPARLQLRLPEVLKRHGVSPSVGLSLGCGSGRAERNLLKQGVCSSFHGIDIAHDAIEQATQTAREAGLDCTYETQDLNDLFLPEATYDLIIAQTSLHHILHLEHVLDQVSFALKPDGVFWVHDYIGESQFQFSDDRLKIINDLLAILPDRLTYNHFSNTSIKRTARREPGSLVSPFESIRSGEIKPLLLDRFEVIESHEESAFLHRVAGLGVKQNFSEDELTKSIFDILFYFDKILIDKNIIDGSLGQFLLKKKFSLGKIF